METDPTVARIVIDSMVPEPCNCSGIEAVADALEAAVKDGKMTAAEAIDRFGSTIDLDCQGMKENEKPLIVGCGSPEMICGHRSGAGFMVRAAFELRTNL